MSLEYEDIDLGKVSEVTAEEFELAELEAKGRVMTLISMFSGNSSMSFYSGPSEIYVYVNGIKMDMDDEFYIYHDFKIGDVIKVYYLGNRDINIMFDAPSAKLIVCPIDATTIYVDCDLDIYDLSPRMTSIDSNGFDLGYRCKIPATVDTIAPPKHSITLDHYVTILWFLGSHPEYYPDGYISVPYDLLSKYKEDNPDYASLFDALVPASQMPKMYKHNIRMLADSQTWQEITVSFMSFKADDFTVKDLVTLFGGLGWTLVVGATNDGYNYPMCLSLEPGNEIVDGRLMVFLFNDGHPDVSSGSTPIRVFYDSVVEI